MEGFFVKTLREFRFFFKLWTLVYPSNLAPFGLKLCQNAFQTIPDISFFNVEKCFRNFERPLTPQTWLRSARNFAKTRFRWSPTFHFSTAKTNVDKKFRRKHILSTPQRIFQQSACFGGAVQVWTSLAYAPRKFIARHIAYDIGFSLLRPLAEG